MSVVDKDSTPTESLDFKYVFADELKISQTRVKEATDLPKYKVFLVYRMFAHDSGGHVVYQQKTDSVTISDFIPEAMALAQQGDTTLVEALQSIEKAVGVILAYKRGKNIEVT